MTRDALTGLPDRRAFRSHARAGQAAVVFDIVGLIHLNDEAGHEAGDAVLRAVAEALAEHIGAHGGDAFRIGGDELVWVPPFDADIPSGARTLCARVAALRVPLLDRPRPLRLSVAQVRIDHDDLADPHVLCSRAADLIHAARVRAGVTGPVFAEDQDG